MDFSEINKRYSALAESTCRLSCGGAFDKSGASLSETCVDLGSGRGTDAIRLAGIVGESGFVYGIDISEGMIKKSEETAKRLGVINAEFRMSPLEKIDLEGDVADLVISNCTINHSYDKQAVWTEIFRILKSGGRFVISDIYSLSEVPDKYKNDPVAVSECWAGAVTRDEYLKQIERAGFNSVSIMEESKPYEKGSIRVSSWTITGRKQ